jgi:hypothetical protein
MIYIGLLGGMYGLIVSFLNGLVIPLAVFLSMLVSADRLLNVLKYAAVRLRTRLTGYKPERSWYFKPLPDDYHDFAKVRNQIIDHSNDHVLCTKMLPLVPSVFIACRLRYNCQCSMKGLCAKQS